MTTLAYTVPTAGVDANSVADPEIATALNTIKTWANGNIDAANLSALLAQSVGANQNSQVVKGASNIAASESRTNVAYGTLPTPDQVIGIVLPTNGLIEVSYQALWQESVAGGGRAAIFIGGNQLEVQSVATAAPATEAASTFTDSTTGINLPLFTLPIGLASAANMAAGFAADATTGQAIGLYGGAQNFAVEIGGTVHQLFGSGLSSNMVFGGPCVIFAAAGTYTVSVQFKASSGSVTASGRKLWVRALSFG